LQQACKRAASSATHLINASSVASKSNSNVASQTQLNTQCHIVSDETVPHVVQALRSVVRLRPGEDQTQVQMALLNAAQDLIQVHHFIFILFRYTIHIPSIQVHHVVFLQFRYTTSYSFYSGKPLYIPYIQVHHFIFLLFR